MSAYLSAFGGEGDMQRCPAVRPDQFKAVAIIATCGFPGTPPK
jgi:hypothetical protein